MPADDILTLLGTVRRHLWRQQGGTALRRALWGTAGASLLAAAAHLLIGPAPALAWGAIGLAWWAGWLAWAAMRRPTDAACALWADRHLGGASAFTTWLELPSAGMGPVAGARPAATVDPRAAAWLHAWVQARLPEVGRQLAAQARALGLGRPLAATLVCAALAGFVLAGPAPSASPAQASAASATGTAMPAAPTASGPANPAAPAPAALQRLAGDLSRTLRDRPRADAGQRRPDAREGKAAAGRPAGAEADPAAPADAGPATGSPAAPAPPGAPTAGGDTARPAIGTLAQAGAGQGQGAGSHADGSPPAPTGRAAAPGLPLRLQPWVGPDPAPQRQADPAQAGTYDDLQTLRRAARAPLPVPAPATAPAAGAEQPLSPTEARYVQAWSQALTRPSR